MDSNNEGITPEILILIITATAIGTFVRIVSIKIDYRQYPNYPNGYLIHVVTGALAAALGAFIIPTLITKNFTAVTFLGLAIQQFREVRKIERESLMDLEGEEFAKRGGAYIDGISKIFESRNYVAMIASFSTALTMQFMIEWTSVERWMEVLGGAFIGMIVFYLLHHFTKRQSVRDVATVTAGKITLRGSELYVDDMLLTNLLGNAEGQKWFQEDGIAAVIHPNKEHFRIPLENPGQRQAILFEVTRRLGQRIYSFQNPGNGKLLIALVPIIKNVDLLKETILLTPLLETVKKSPELLGIKQGGQKNGER